LLLQVVDDHHAKLVLIELSKNSDKYFILQVLSAKASPRSKKVSYYHWTRWGKTGTGGQGMMEGPFSAVDEAIDAFEAKFKQKTGNKWDARDQFAVKKGKYDLVPPDAAAVSAIAGQGAMVWQYQLTNDPMGKPDGWYDYDSENGAAVEELYGDLAQGKQAVLSVRFVTSPTSSFTYRVDLKNMQQQNTKSGTVREDGKTGRRERGGGGGGDSGSRVAMSLCVFFSLSVSLCLSLYS
jgi:predicted DNA-binding WGR domain protein